MSFGFIVGWSLLSGLATWLLLHLFDKQPEIKRLSLKQCRLRAEVQLLLDGEGIAEVELLESDLEGFSPWGGPPGVRATFRATPEEGGPPLMGAFNCVPHDFSGFEYELQEP